MSLTHDDDYVDLEDSPGYDRVVHTVLPPVQALYEQSLKKMELNRLLADQRWEEILAEVKRDIAWNKSHKAKQTLTGNPRTIANERSKSDGIFKSRAGDYAFHKGRVDTYAAILNLQKQERVIQRLDALIVLFTENMLNTSNAPHETT